ncbi:MAG: hypothetical protein MI867_05730, partial [Pseudomonadales bacterium]|nr:hypothetical protein [Pseudomonadales bacterium]
MKSKRLQGLNLLEGDLTKKILKLGLPMMLGALAQSLYNIADAFWVGKLGKAAVSAPGISFFIIYFLIAIGLGFSVAGTSLVSQYIGAGDTKKATDATGDLMFLLIVIPTTLSIFAYIFARPLLEFMRTPPDAMEVTLSYFGLGVGEPAVSWGSLLAELQRYHVMTSYWWMWSP